MSVKSSKPFKSEKQQLLHKITSTVGKTKGAPVQVHGEIWENEIKSIYGVVSSDEEQILYTEAHDIPKQFNRRNSTRNVSIKVTGNNSVCFGDANRIYKTLKRSSPLDVVVVKYTQQGDTKNVRQVERYNFDNVGMNLFGSESHTIEGDLHLLHEKLKRGDTSYKDLAKSLQKRITDSGGYVTLNPKIGNPEKRRQGRLQMSISSNNWDKLLREKEGVFVDREKCSVFGCPISSSIQSKRRVFKKTTEKKSVARGINNSNKTRKILKLSKNMKLAKKILDTI